MSNNSGKSEPRGGPAPRRSAGRGLLGTVCAAALILLGFGFVAARTAGFRSYVQDEVRKRTGAPVAIGKTRIGWPYDLVLEDVRVAAETGRGGGVLTIASVRVGLAWDFGWRFTVMGPRLSLQRNHSGEWSPAVAASLGPLKTLSEISDLTAGFREGRRREIRDGFVEWLDEDGRCLSSVKGVEFVMLPLAAPRRVLYYYTLSARDMQGPGDRRTRDVRWEWIGTEERPYVEIDSRMEHVVTGTGDSLWGEPSDSREREKQAT